MSAIAVPYMFDIGEVITLSPKTRVGNDYQWWMSLFVGKKYKIKSRKYSRKEKYYLLESSQYPLEQLYIKEKYLIGDPVPIEFTAEEILNIIEGS